MKCITPLSLHSGSEGLGAVSANFDYLCDGNGVGIN